MLAKGGRRSEDNKKGEILEEPIFNFPKGTMKFQMILSKTTPIRKEKDSQHHSGGARRRRGWRRGRVSVN